MKTNNVGLVRACNIVSTVALLLITVLQFLPFWFNGEVIASIQEYVWFPKEHKELTKYFQELTGNGSFRVNDMMLMPALMLAGSALGIIFCAFKSGSVFTAVFPAICGVVGIIGYLSSPIFQTFEYWWMHLAVCVAMLLFSAVTLYVGLSKGKKKSA